MQSIVMVVGYTKDSDEWVGSDRLRSKLIKLKAGDIVKSGGMPALAPR